MFGTAQMIPKKKTALDYGNLWVNISQGGKGQLGVGPIGRV